MAKQREQEAAIDRPDDFESSSSDDDDLEADVRQTNKLIEEELKGVFSETMGATSLIAKSG